MSPALQLHCKSNTHSFLSTEAKDVWRRTRFMFLAHRRGVLEAGFSYYLAHQYISTVSISLLDQWAQRGSQSASSVAFFLITFIRIHLAYRVRPYIFAFIVSGGTWWNFNDSSFCELWKFEGGRTQLRETIIPLLPHLSLSPSPSLYFWTNRDILKHLLANRLSPPPSVLPAAEMTVLLDPGSGCQVAGRYQVPTGGSTDWLEFVPTQITS